MTAERKRPEDNPHESSMIDEVAERVFINYEPPQQENLDEQDDEESGTDESAA